jgi:TonB-dependent starch-binding outer membrane protein SusC
MRFADRSPRGLLIAVTLGFIACAAPRPATTPSQQGASTANVDGAGKTLAELFEGKFPGVRVTAVSTNGVRLVIRNATNIDGSSAYPLYVVDGSPVAAPDGVFSINPVDVLKIEILKDDASSLIYGQAAANGVVKITTKRK